MTRNSVLTFASFFMLLASCNNIDFDSEKWKNWRETEASNMRWDMSDDLIDNYLHEGMNVSAVEGLIGKVPLDTVKQEHIAYYNLGPCRRGIDYGTLEIRYVKGKIKSIDRRCN